MSGSITRHCGRLGGVIVRPRATLATLRGAPPRFEELLPWLALATAAADPVRAGQAILLGRIAPIDGLLLFLQQVVQRFLPGIIGAFVVGGILYALDRSRGKKSYEIWSSIAAFTLVPHILLVMIGGALGAQDLDAWFLPHHAITGIGWVVPLRLLVAYGWSLGIAAVWLGLLFSEARPEGSTT